MIKLYLARHGETAANRSGVYYGRSDLPLIERGIAQSQRLADALRGVAFSHRACSDLLRARQTAEIVCPGAAVEARAEFSELDFGAWEGLHYRQLEQQDAERYAAWCDDWIHQAPPGGESFLTFKARVEYGLTQLLSGRSDDTLLLVSHQGVLRVIMLLLLNMADDGFWRFTFEHGAYSLISIERGHAVIEKINAG